MHSNFDSQYSASERAELYAHFSGAQDMATYGHEGGGAFNDDQRGGHDDAPLTQDEMREACRVSEQEVETCAHVLAHAQEDTIKDFRECGLIQRGDSLSVHFGVNHILASAEYRAQWQVFFAPNSTEKPHSEFGLTLAEAVTRMKWWLECNGPKHS